MIFKIPNYRGQQNVFIKAIKENATTCVSHIKWKPFETNMADKLSPLFFGSDLGLHFIVIDTHTFYCLIILSDI